MVSATSEDFLAKWNFNLLNQGRDSMKIVFFERKGEDLSSGWGKSQFIPHEEFLKKAKDAEQITIVCKVRITNKEFLHSKRIIDFSFPSTK
jgi:hypothetical protein